MLQLSVFVVKCCFSVCKEEEEEDAGRKNFLKDVLGFVVSMFGLCKHLFVGKGIYNLICHQHLWSLYMQLRCSKFY